MHLSSLHNDVLVVGASGRMGAMICNLALRDEQFSIRAGVCPPVDDDAKSDADARRRTSRDALHRAGVRIINSDQIMSLQCEMIDTRGKCVIIDFSTDVGTNAACSLAFATGSPMLVGTTALGQGTIGALKALSERAPVLVCSNTSVGVAAVAAAAQMLCRAMGPTYSVSITERHHIHKKDAPSGTAKRLANAIRQGGGKLLDSEIFSVREGEIVGEHTIRLSGEGETIELTHRAETRELFARGALRLAAWLVQQRAGWYSVEDSLARETVI